MKKLTVLIILLISCSLSVEAIDKDLNETNEIITGELKRIDLDKLEREVDELNKEVGEYLPQLSREDIVDLFSKQGFREKLSAILQGLLKYLFDEIIANGKLLGQLIALAMIVAILKTFQSNFASNEISILANSIIYLVLAIIALNSFKVAITVGKGAINNMVDIMQAILPLLLTLLVSMGNLTSAALFHPISFLTVNTLSALIKNLVFPLILLATILDVVNNLSKEFKVTGMASLFRQVIIGILGVVMTIFIAIIVAQGTIATVSDGVTIRTAKYLTGSFVPVIGGFLANALDMVIGGSLLIKNALGLFAVLIILVYCTFSIIKIIALVFIYRLASAIIQPISDGKIVNCLDKLANNLLLLFAAVASVGLMFFVVIIIMVGVANFTVMMR